MPFSVRQKGSKKRTYDYNTSWFVAELARRAYFTHSDIEVILSTMREIFQDILAEKKSLILAGLFGLQIKPKRLHPDESQRKPRQTEYRPYIKASPILLRKLEAINQGEAGDVRQEEDED